MAVNDDFLIEGNLCIGGFGAILCFSSAWRSGSDGVSKTFVFDVSGDVS